MRALGYFWIKNIDQVSPRSLAEAITLYCQAHGHQLEGMYSDAGSLRTLDNGSQFAQMTQFVRCTSREYLVLVPDASHFGSDLEEVARAALRLNEVKAKTQCLDPRNPNTLENALQLLGIKGVSRERSELIKNAMANKAIRGWGLGRPLYGYKIGEAGKLEIVPEEAAVVQQIFDLYTKEKLGLRKIVAHLNEKGVANRRKALWNIVTLRDLLRNSAYVGTYARFGFRLPKNHQPIVPQSDFRQAQEMMSSRRPKREWTEIEPFVLSGLVYCGHCGNKMIGMTRRQAWKRKDGTDQKGQYRYYQCQSKTNQSMCQYHTWRAPLLEEVIRSQLFSMVLKDYSLLANTLSNTHIREEIATSEKRFTKAFRRAAQGKLALPVLGQYLAQVDKARKTPTPNGSTNQSAATNPFARESWDSLEPGARRSLLKSLVVKIVVKDKEAQIEVVAKAPAPLPQPA